MDLVGFRVHLSFFHINFVSGIDPLDVTHFVDFIMESYFEIKELYYGEYLVDVSVVRFKGFNNDFNRFD